RGRPRKPEGLAGGQPHHRPSGDVRKGVAPRRVDADHLRGDGADPPAASAGAVRATATVKRGAIVVKALAFGALLLALALFPFVAGAYPVKLLEEILIWSAFAMSLDLLMGYAGMVSFGHSAFFGVGGYVAALALKTSPGLVSALLWPALAAASCALVIGFFSIRVSGVYFIMLTLA